MISYESPRYVRAHNGPVYRTSLWAMKKELQNLKPVYREYIDSTNRCPKFSGVYVRLLPKADIVGTKIPKTNEILINSFTFANRLTTFVKIS